jgi:hypothetical protein
MPGMSEATGIRRPAWGQTAAVLAVAAGTGAYVHFAIAPGKALLFVVGVLLGLVLMHAAYGFTAQWRRFLVYGDGSGIRAQMVMLALGSLLVMPLIASGKIFGHAVAGAYAPAGVSVAVGAFMFGLAMQLANGCASGTLYALGGGSLRMMIVLPFFLIGSLWGSADLPWWFRTPSLGSVSLLHKLGLWPALLMQLAVFAGIFLLAWRIEKWARAAGTLPPSAGAEGRFDAWRLLTGPWSWLAGGILLALLNFAVFAVAGHAWTISFGYTLWGAKLAQLLGLDLVLQSPFWTWPYPRQALAGHWLAEDTSLTNLAIIIGAALATTLAGGFRRPQAISWRAALGAAIGGLLMGYGARIAFGCNVGAYFSGIISGSLHGWQWLVFGMMGTALGIRLRPLFDLKN